MWLSCRMPTFSAPPLPQTGDTTLLKMFTHQTLMSLLLWCQFLPTPCQSAGRGCWPGRSKRNLHVGVSTNLLFIRCLAIASLFYNVGTCLLCHLLINGRCACCHGTVFTGITWRRSFILTALPAFSCHNTHAYNVRKYSFIPTYRYMLCMNS
jgi:hypothetical protein